MNQDLYDNFEEGIYTYEQCMHVLFKADECIVHCKLCMQVLDSYAACMPYIYIYNIIYYNYTL